VKVTEKLYYIWLYQVDQGYESNSQLNNLITIKNRV
jgi:hypothetical protein